MEAAKFLNSPRHICKGCPLRPCCQPGCKFLLLVWLLQSCSDLLPGSVQGWGEGREISWWRSVLWEATCAGIRAQTSPSLPPPPGPRFSHNGTQLVLAAVSTSLWFILGIQQHRPGHDNSTTTPGPAATGRDNNTTTFREEQDWSDQIVRTAWLRWPWPGRPSSDRGILDNVVMEPPWSRPGPVFTPQSRVTCQQPWKWAASRVQRAAPDNQELCAGQALAAALFNVL